MPNDLYDLEFEIDVDEAIAKKMLLRGASPLGPFITKVLAEGSALPQYGQMLRRKNDGLIAMYVCRTSGSGSMIVCMDDNPADEGWITDRDMIQNWELVVEDTK